MDKAASPTGTRLETLVTRVRRPRRRRPRARGELRELALLYRQTAADLSVAREDPSGGADWRRYLNTLLGRAHNLIYSGARPPAARRP